MAARKKVTARTPKEASTLWRIAVHEAGHAVAAHALGIPLDEVSIVPGIATDGRYYAGSTSLAHDPLDVMRALDEYYDVDTEGDDKEEKAFFFLFKNMQVLFAGMFAEELFFEAAEESGLGPDFDEISSYAERLCPPDAKEIDERTPDLPAEIMSDEAITAAAKFFAAMPKQEEDYLIDWVKHRTRKLVRTRQDIIKAVALKLQQRRRLTGTQVVRTILSAMRRRWRTSKRLRKASDSASRRRPS